MQYLDHSVILRQLDGGRSMTYHAAFRHQVRRLVAIHENVDDKDLRRSEWKFPTKMNVEITISATAATLVET